MTVSLAGSAPERSSTARSLARCTVKLPLICPVPPRIGSRMTGAEITLSSSTMAKGRPTFSWVTLPKRLAPAASKRKVDHRLAGAAVEARLGVDQILPAHQGLALEHIGNGRRVVGIDELVAGRHLLGGGGLGRVDGGIDQLEFELAGLADQRLQALDVLRCREPGRERGCGLRAGCSARWCRRRRRGA